MSRDCDANHAPRVYIYVLNAGFPQVYKKYQIFFQIIYGVFLTFLPKNQRWQLRFGKLLEMLKHVLQHQVRYLGIMLTRLASLVDK
jgi:hypothetical protein